MFHRIESARALSAGKLHVVFADGTAKVYDTSNLAARHPAFSALSNAMLFNSVRVDSGGYGVSWNDDLDLSCNELWENGTSPPRSF